MSGAEDGNLFGEERKTRIDSIMRGDGPWRGHGGVRSLCKSQFSNLRLTPGMQGEETSLTASDILYNFQQIFKQQEIFFVSD